MHKTIAEVTEVYRGAVRLRVGAEGHRHRILFDVPDSMEQDLRRALADNRPVFVYVDVGGDERHGSGGSEILERVDELLAIEDDMEKRGDTWSAPTRPAGLRRAFVRLREARSGHPATKRAGEGRPLKHGEADAVFAKVDALLDAHERSADGTVLGWALLPDGRLRAALSLPRPANVYVGGTDENGAWHDGEWEIIGAGFLASGREETADGAKARLVLVHEALTRALR